MFQFTEDQLAIQELVRDYAKNEIAPRADEIDKTGRFPKENLDGLLEMGVLQMTIPEEYGGTGLLNGADMPSRPGSRNNRDQYITLRLPWLGAVILRRVSPGQA